MIATAFPQPIRRRPRASASLLAALAAGAVALSGCQPDSPPQPSPTSPSAVITTQDVTPSATPSVATPSVTPSLTPTPTASAPALTAGFVDRLDGSTAAIPLAQTALKALRGTADGLAFNTTPRAYDNLIAGNKDVILVSYPSEEELAAAKEAGIELEIVPLVKDGLVFLANTANPVSGLTTQQIKDVYTGAVTDWGQVGGEPGAILPYQRPVGSGSQTLFLKEVMAGTTPMDAPTALRPAEMSGLVDGIAATDNGPTALGYSVLFYATQMYMKDTVKLLAVDGVAPSARSISDDSYPFITHVNAVFRKDTPADSPVRAFVDWLLGDDAQKLASAANYVPMDAANIVAPAQPVYYLGANPENTTVSTGTGGTDYRPLTAMPASGYSCDDKQGTAAPVLTVAGHPEVGQAVTRWLGERYNPASLIGCYSATVYQELISVGVLVYQPDGSGALMLAGNDGAVFDVATGRRLGLSDLFFDGFNFIGFLNDNLANPWTNQIYRDSNPQGADDIDAMTGFTGISRDHAAFELVPWAAQVVLEIDFPQGNPFVSGQMTGDLWSPFRIPLPVSLSPYGAAWTVGYEIPPGAGGASSQYSWGIPVLSTGFPEPRATDAAVNAAIKAAATKAAAGQAAVTSEDRGLYGSRLSVVFQNGPIGDRTVASLTTVDLITGQTSSYSEADIPPEWWKTPNVSVMGSGDGLSGYVPPKGTTYRNVRRGFSDVSFEVVEPSGRVLEASVQV